MQCSVKIRTEIWDKFQTLLKHHLWSHCWTHICQKWPSPASGRERPVRGADVSLEAEQAWGKWGWQIHKGGQRWLGSEMVCGGDRVQYVFCEASSNFIEDCLLPQSHPSLIKAFHALLHLPPTVIPFTHANPVSNVDLQYKWTTSPGWGGGTIRVAQVWLWKGTGGGKDEVGEARMFKMCHPGH